MAAQRKRIVCLASSTKLGGRCVAGIELRDGEPKGWIRPVSTEHGGEVPEPVQLGTGGVLALLDIIEISVKKHCPTGCQVENYLYDPGTAWEKVGTFDPANLPTLAQRPADIWGLGTGFGNSKAPYPASEQLGSSLLFVSARDAKMAVIEWDNGDITVSAQFTYRGNFYSFKVTDPEQKQRYIAQGVGDYPLGPDSHICASLAEPYGTFRYKLAAAVFMKGGPA